MLMTFAEIAEETKVSLLKCADGLGLISVLHLGHKASVCDGKNLKNL